MPDSSQSCSLQINSEISDFSKKQLKIIEGRISLAKVGKVAIIFGNILSFFTRSSSKRVLAAKGSVDTGNMNLAITNLDKVTLKLIETDAATAMLRTKGAESQAWRKMVVCIRSKM